MPVPPPPSTPSNRGAASGGLTLDGFAAAFRAQYRLFVAIASAFTGPAGAEDAVQQAAITAMQHLHEFTPGTDFRAWMSAIVRGAARNLGRADRRRASRHTRLAEQRPSIGAAVAGEPGGEGPIRLRPGGRAPEVEIPASVDARVRNALESVEPLERACLLLRAMADLSYREIGEMLEIPESTARSHVHRVRTRLARELNDPTGASGGA